MTLCIVSTENRPGGSVPMVGLLDFISHKWQSKRLYDLLVNADQR